ncbi:MAG: hypothetical protein SFV23_16770 [Planctomycetaceae bacterium]|nr:hypothetical protein [Planctomycetaceae bacterium]
MTWFLRNGNLYRRVLLLRERDQNASQNGQPEFDPGTGSQRRFFSPAAAPVYPGGFQAASNFWRDFDFSAHSSQAKDTSGGSMVPPAYNYDGAVFNGIASLDVPTTLPFIVDVAPEHIAYPPNRFGHNYVDRNPISGGAFAVGGQPKEYTQSGGAFLGRFTQQETSDANFLYPQQNHLNASNPLAADLEFTEDANNNQILDAGEDANGNRTLDLYVGATSLSDGGTRRGEDLVLANVHAFDVKVYDEVLQRFVDVGHSEPAVGGLIGDYHIGNRQNSFYGSGSSTGNRVFDTWYPFNTSFPEDANGNLTLDTMPTDEDQNANGELDPQQVLDFDNNGAIANEDINGDGMLSGAEDAIANGLLDHENNPPYRPRKIWPNDTTISGFSRTRLARWQANFNYIVGDRIFPPLGTQPGDPFYYVCVQAEDGDMVAGTSSQATAPSFSRIAGLNTQEGNVAALQDQLTWQAVDNRKPLRAIQITLRFLDTSTSQMRTLTIQQGLID